MPRAEGAAPLRAIASGEEVELVCVGPAPLPSSVQLVGELTPGGQVVVVDGEGNAVDIADRGWDHFA